MRVLELCRKLGDKAAEVRVLMWKALALDYNDRPEEAAKALDELEPIVTNKDDKELGAYSLLGIDYLRQRVRPLM